MKEAAFWCLATGILWTGVGIYFKKLNDKAHDPVNFNISSAVFLFIICLFTVKWGSLSSTMGIEATSLFKLAVVMLAAGMTMTAGLIIMIKSMNRGRPDAAWSICQSSMLIPFSLGVLLNGETINMFNIAGIMAILGGIAIFGQGKKRSGTQFAEANWFTISLVGFLVIGAGQYLFSIPSYWENWTDKYALRIPIQATGGLGLLFVWAGIGGFKNAVRTLWLHGLVFALLTYAGRFTLYKAIDALAELKMVAIAYPVCLGLSILGFVAYHSYSERKFNPASVLVSILLIAGLLMLGIK